MLGIPDQRKIACGHSICRGLTRALIGLLLAVLTLDLSWAEEPAGAMPRTNTDDPPPVEELLRPPPPRMRSESSGLMIKGAPKLHYRVKLPCDPKNTSYRIDAAIATQIYKQLRGCWNPPPESKVFTEIRFLRSDENTKPPDAGQPTISIAVRLDRDGRLAAAPQADLIRPSPEAKVLVGDVVRAIERCQPFLQGFDISRPWRDFRMGIRVEGLGTER
jgi:hypothetical protein